jgi:hypothetical protein
MREYTIECRRATSSSFKTVKCAHLAEAKKLAARLFGKSYCIHIFVNGEHAAYRFAGFHKWFETGIA